MTKPSVHLQNILSEIIEVRKQLHQIPELKYEELKTAELIAARNIREKCMLVDMMDIAQQHWLSLMRYIKSKNN